MNTKFNKYIHIAFIAYGLYVVFVEKNLETAFIYLGLALAFDPFNPSQKWNERPQWQRGILIAELVFTFLLMISAIWPDLKAGFLDGLRGS